MWSGGYPEPPSTRVIYCDYRYPGLPGYWITPRCSDRGVSGEIQDVVGGVSNVLIRVGPFWALEDNLYPVLLSGGQGLVSGTRLGVLPFH